jgi:hypothetical protein
VPRPATPDGYWLSGTALAPRSRESIHAFEPFAAGSDLGILSPGLDQSLVSTQKVVLSLLLSLHSVYTAPSLPIRRTTRQR